MNLSGSSQDHRQKAANALVFPPPPPIFASDGPEFSTSIVNVRRPDNCVDDTPDAQLSALGLDLWNVDPFNAFDVQLGLDGDPFGLFESAAAMDPLASCFTPRPVYSLFPDRDIPMLARTPMPVAPSTLPAPSTSSGEAPPGLTPVPQLKEPLNMSERATGPNVEQDKVFMFVPSAPFSLSGDKSRREGFPYYPVPIDPDTLQPTAEYQKRAKASRQLLQKNRNKQIDAQSPSSSSPAMSTNSIPTSQGSSDASSSRERVPIPDTGAVELKPWNQDESLQWKVTTTQSSSPTRDLQHHRAGPLKKDPFLVIDKPKVSKPRCTDIGPQWKARITAERNQRLDKYEAEQARIQAELAARPKPVVQPKPIVYTLVKLRNTDQNSKTKGKFVWYLAREKNAKENLYLVVSGPMAGMTKTVRPYDRKPYSPEVERQLADSKEVLDTKITLPIEAIIDPNSVKPQRPLRYSELMIALHHNPAE